MGAKTYEKAAGSKLSSSQGASTGRSQGRLVQGRQQGGTAGKQGAPQGKPQVHTICDTEGNVPLRVLAHNGKVPIPSCINRLVCLLMGSAYMSPSARHPSIWQIRRSA